MLILTFCYDDNIMFEFLRLLLNLLREDKYIFLENYEALFHKYYITNKNDIKIFIIKIKKIDSDEDDIQKNEINI